MREADQLSTVKPILTYYGIEPHFVERFGKVHKIYGNNGTFALKKIEPQHGTDFIRHVQTLYQKGYHRIVPIYPTTDGRYAVLHERSLYYLMPWLPNEERENRAERHRLLLRELARMHTLSVQEVKVSKEERTEHYEKMTLVYEKEQQFIDEFISECERKVYPSPFELLFCLSYHDINQALTYAKNKLGDWFEASKDAEKVRTVLTHGKLSTEHFLYDDRGYGYFSNFEKTRQGAPFQDLLPFLAKTLKTYPKQSEETIDWLYTYFKFFPLKGEEMSLFLSYFAHPGPIMKVAERYYKAENRVNERKYTEQLEKQHWLLKNSEYVIMRVNEIEQQKKQAQQEAQNQAEVKEGAQD
ncbi:spore coat protein YsxE [Bacillaceae bacterium Marseille-Q3522]|nr:spore coat protein YsxE [Bacillaceae bacterium Marseille-Q3522]